MTGPTAKVAELAMWLPRIDFADRDHVATPLPGRFSWQLSRGSLVRARFESGHRHQSKRLPGGAFL